jgi:quinol monooxygenase YgiN
MSEPVFFLSRFRIKQGSLEAVRQLTRDVAGRLQEEKPRTALFLSYIDADGEVISFLHAFADAEAMDLHFAGADERARAAYEHVEPLGWEVYGRPSEVALESLRQAATFAGAPLAVYPAYAAGFLRLAPGE